VQNKNNAKRGPKSLDKRGIN